MLPSLLASVLAINVASGPSVADPSVSVPALSRSALIESAVRESAGSGSAEVTVLTYNVRGLPWPVALGRAKALRAIGEELATMRREGRQPTIVLIQEGFRGEMADLVKASGYPYWVKGPARGDPRIVAAKGDAAEGSGFKPARYWLRGEGWGKFIGGGLHVLSDLPIEDVRTTAFRHCAGFDCLANKGVMMARVRLRDTNLRIDVMNTHMNSRKAAGVPRARSSKAHNLQTDEFVQFVEENQAHWPVLLGGDFNVKNAPERYDHLAAKRPFVVVDEYCAQTKRGCGPLAPQGVPGLRSQDLQGFAARNGIEVRPEDAREIFSSGAQQLSDHAGYLVRYRLSWTGSPWSGEPQSQLAAVP